MQKWNKNGTLKDRKNIAKLEKNPDLTAILFYKNPEINVSNVILTSMKNYLNYLVIKFINSRYHISLNKKLC